MSYEGTVTTNQDQFYGLSVEALETYIANIKSTVISSSGDSAKSKLESGKKALYEALRKGWTGEAEETFEKRFEQAIKETIEILEDSEKKLEGYLKAIANAWIEQDKNLIGE